MYIQYCICRLDCTLHYIRHRTGHQPHHPSHELSARNYFIEHATRIWISESSDALSTVSFVSCATLQSPPDHAPDHRTTRSPRPTKTYLPLNCLLLYCIAACQPHRNAQTSLLVRLSSGGPSPRSAVARYITVSLTPALGFGSGSPPAGSLGYKGWATIGMPDWPWGARFDQAA